MLRMDRNQTTADLYRFRHVEDGAELGQHEFTVVVPGGEVDDGEQCGQSVDDGVALFALFQ